MINFSLNFQNLPLHFMVIDANFNYKNNSIRASVLYLKNNIYQFNQPIKQ